MTIVLPPVEPDLPRLVDGADDQPDADCEELDFGDRDANVAGDGKSLVEHAVENIDDATGAMTCGSLYEHSLPLRRTEAVQQRWCFVRAVLRLPGLGSPSRFERRRGNWRWPAPSIPIASRRQSRSIRAQEALL